MALPNKSSSTSAQKRSSDSQRTVSAAASKSTTTLSAAVAQHPANHLAHSLNQQLPNHFKKMTNNK
jgi:hypothetical protein